VATSAGAEYCRADREVLQVRLNYLSHDISLHLQRDPAAFEVFCRDLTVGRPPAGDHVFSPNCSQDLLLLPASVLGKRTTRGEPAPGRRIDRRAHLAGPHQASLPSRGTAPGH